MSKTAQPIDPNLTINEIVLHFPKALPVLHRAGLDTCCGGARPLAEVADRHGLDLDELLAELTRAAAEEP